MQSRLNIFRILEISSYFLFFVLFSIRFSIFSNENLHTSLCECTIGLMVTCRQGRGYGGLFTNVLPSHSMWGIRYEPPIVVKPVTISLLNEYDDDVVSSVSSGVALCCFDVLTCFSGDVTCFSDVVTCVFDVIVRDIFFVGYL